ncbi:MAG: M20 family metallopeptidase [Anaerolineae bacterium]
MSNVDDLKSHVVAEVDARRDELIRISDTIHAKPELAFQEFEAAALLTSVLEREGFTVQRGVAGLETAFVASHTSQKGDRPVVALLAEYDALADLGHACGHNIIGTASVGAALALCPVLDQLPGTIQVIGTPAEEGGGGKITMAEASIFDGVDAAMMVHPSTRTMTRRTSLACYELKMEFFGQSAHAAASPDKGINALDACILAYNNVSALRQQLTDDVRIHGIITHGGSAPNIIPDYTAAEFLVRAAEKDDALAVLAKVEDCARAGALAAGAEVKLTRADEYYANMVFSTVLADLFDANLTALGREVQLPLPNERMGSTDMGNVSHVVPALHAYVTIAPEEVAGHSPEFRAASASSEGHAGLLDAAKALAMTAIDLLSNPDLVDAAWEEHRAHFG